MSRSNISVGTKGWADRINGAWRKSAAAIIETGQLLVECKAAVRHGEFTKMLQNELDFNETAAIRLMQIAGDERLSNPAILQFLPRHFITLHDLRELSDEQLREGIAAGTINTEMRRADVRQLRGPKKPKGKVTDAEYDEVEAPSPSAQQSRNAESTTPPDDACPIPTNRDE